MPTIETVAISDPSLLTFEGAPLPVDSLQIAVLLDDAPDAPQPVDVRLLAELDFFNWTRIAGTAAFGLDLADCAPDAFAGFDATRPLRIEARLAEPALSLLGPVAEPLDAVKAFHAAELASPLRRAETWAVIAVTQERSPGVRAGFAARPPR